MTATALNTASRYCLLAAVIVACGCGTTRWSDTTRTATEQLLLTDAIDRSVQQLNLRVLAGKQVYLDISYLDGVVDKGYLISTIRQHMLASGCIVKEKKEDAVYVVEARAGAVGTNRHDLLYGVPATNLPSGVPIPGIPSSVPEIPFAKRTNQLGVVKVAVFAYHRETGTPVWQSGIATEKSRARDFWLFGAGPFQKGTIYDGTVFAGQKFNNPLIRRTPEIEGDVTAGINIDQEVVFQEGKSRSSEALVAGRAEPAVPESKPTADGSAPTLEVGQAGYESPIPQLQSPPAPPAEPRPADQSAAPAAPSAAPSAAPPANQLAPPPAEPAASPANPSGPSPGYAGPRYQ